MGLYEETIAVIIEDVLEWATPVSREISPGVFEDGFESEEHCGLEGCKYYRLGGFGSRGCTYDYAHSDIRMEGGGAMSGGRCFEFRTWDEFWNEFLGSYAIDPDTGEVLNI